MAVDDPMTVDERRKYLRQMQERYFKADRQGRSKLLDEMQAVTGLHRKSLVRLIRGKLARKPRRKQRGPAYGLRVRRALGVIAESLDYVCAERLQPNLVWMAGHLAQHGELEISPSTLEKLSKISVSTVRRLLKDLQKDQPRLPRKGPEQANRFAREVPTQRIPWNEQQPGHFEVDLVHHCGVSATGQYVHTLQMVDVATGWSERVAVLGRSYRVMQDGFERIQARLPFPILELHPDNDAAFFNNFLMRFWGDQVSSPAFSRSRPYKKNDNAHIEQKNYTHVRQILGYVRYDTPEAVDAINALYHNELRVFQNYFQPSVKLQKKIRIGSKVKKIYDAPQTPYQRLAKSGKADLKKLQAFKTGAQAWNPFQLSEIIEQKLSRIYALASKTPKKWMPSPPRHKLPALPTPILLQTALPPTLLPSNPLSGYRQIYSREKFLQTW